jgi:FixJ family two-component response regulator
MNTAVAAEKQIVHVVDDDESLRTATARLLGAAGYEVRTYASAGEFALARDATMSGCVLLDVRMPGPSGLDLQDSLARNSNPLPIIFLTGHGDIPMSVRAMKAGAVDFLTKPVERSVLLAAVEAALARDSQEYSERMKRHAWRERFDSLSPREREVFERVTVGQPNKQIAGEIEAAERTVKAHRARVMEKMGARSLAELVHIAEQLRRVG